MKKSTQLGILVILLSGGYTDIKGMAEEQLTLKSIDRYNIQEPVFEVEREFIEIDVELSFYTGLACENTPLGAVDAQGNALIWGTIAVPRTVSLGTEFSFDNYPDMIFTARDRGSVKHIRVTDKGVYRMDVYCPRKQGESDSAYYKRVNNYGKIKTKGKLYTD